MQCPVSAVVFVLGLLALLPKGLNPIVASNLLMIFTEILLKHSLGFHMMFL